MAQGRDEIRKSPELGRIVLVPDPFDRRRGFLRAPGFTIRCAIGRSGLTGRKREGDGATPRGRLGLVSVFYRADRLPRPATRLTADAIRFDDGWCDDPASPCYNRWIRLPARPRHERLWRDDRIYDVVVVLDYNLARPRHGAGSAIFLHLARPGYPPTEGCVAVSLADMRRLLSRAGRGSFIDAW